METKVAQKQHQRFSRPAPFFSRSPPNCGKEWVPQLAHCWFCADLFSGVCVAAILSVAALLGGFVHFRQSVLDARRGKFRFRKSDAKLVFATGFIGINISSAIISYILIVGLVTLVALPFTFELTWRVIWDYVPTILVAFVLPAVISFVQMKALKKFLFGGTFIKTRAGQWHRNAWCLDFWKFTFRQQIGLATTFISRIRLSWSKDV